MCNCIEQMDKKLAPFNTTINATFYVKDGTLSMAARVEAYRTDPLKRTKLKSITATFCPFCGERYKPE